MIKIQTLTIVPKIFTSPLECKAPDMITFLEEIMYHMTIISCNITKISC